MANLLSAMGAHNHHHRRFKYLLPHSQLINKCFACFFYLFPSIHSGISGGRKKKRKEKLFFWFLVLARQTIKDRREQKKKKNIGEQVLQCFSRIPMRFGCYIPVVAVVELAIGRGAVVVGGDDDLYLTGVYSSSSSTLCCACDTSWRIFVRPTFPIFFRFVKPFCRGVAIR